MVFIKVFLSRMYTENSRQVLLEGGPLSGLKQKDEV